MSTQESGDAKPAAVKGPLDGLTQRLGALGESLTVVAGELGVSSVPKFKRLDPETVYREAIKRAQEVVEPLRLALRKLDSRLEEMAVAQAQMRREASGARESYARSESVAALDGQIAALAARLDATVMPIDQNETRINALNDAIARLSRRVDAVVERLEAQSHAERESKSTGEPGEAAMAQRLAALEYRLERMANAASQQEASIVENGIAEERLAAFQSRITAEIERRLSQLAATPAAAAPAVDPAVIAAEIARQLQAMGRESSTSSDPMPLLINGPADRAPAELNPLVVSATERAIVRLTHRLEKLEEWRRRKSGQSNSKSGLMSRLFES